jgi:hypothetical protein
MPKGSHIQTPKIASSLSLANVNSEQRHSEIITATLINFPEWLTPSAPENTSALAEGQRVVFCVTRLVSAHGTCKHLINLNN